jgi:hypothetical protein
LTDDFGTVMRQAKTILAESCPRLDVRAMSRAGCLEDGQRGTYFPVPGIVVGFICGNGALTVTHEVAGQPMEQLLRLERTACFGNQSRSWFLCPHCTRRAAVLFAVAEHGFACRACGKVSYQCQRLDATARSWRTETAVERQLGPCRSRRRYMHTGTYERLLRALNLCEERRNAELVEWATSRYKLR